jgi:hypothetical protein
VLKFWARELLSSAVAYVVKYVSPLDVQNKKERNPPTQMQYVHQEDLNIYSQTLCIFWGGEGDLLN